MTWTYAVVSADAVGCIDLARARPCASSLLSSSSRSPSRPSLRTPPPAQSFDIGAQRIDLGTHLYGRDGLAPLGPIANADANGIVRVAYPGVPEPQYNPVTISIYAVRWANAYRVSPPGYANKPEYLRLVRLYADFLWDWRVEVSGPYGTEAWYPYLFDSKVLGRADAPLTAPWYSGMGQGYALSTYAWAYEITGDAKYLGYAEATLRSLQSVRGPDRQGEAGDKPWAAFVDDAGFYWVEEYPVGGFAPRVLNGFGFAVAGFYDYWRVSGSPESYALLDRTLATLYAYGEAWHVPGSASRYCLGYPYQSVHYDAIHIDQFEFFEAISEEGRFGELASLYDTHAGPPALAVSGPPDAFPGQTVEVDVSVEGVTDLFGVALEVYASGGEVVGAGVGPLLDDGDVIEFADGDGAHLSFAATRKRGAAGVSGSGVLATVTLRPTGEGPLVVSVVRPTGSTSSGGAVALSPAMLPIPVHAGPVVWPGDTDASGTVTAADVLPLGAFFGLTGPPRAPASAAWEPQPASVWADEPSTHADANGDGVVSAADLLPVGANFGQTRAAARRAVGPPLATLDVSLAPGEPFTFDVTAAAGGLGAAARLSLPPGLTVEAAGPSGRLDTGDVLTFDSTAGGVLEVGASRKRGAPALSGPGALLSVTVRAERAVSGVVALHALAVSDATGATAPAVAPGLTTFGATAAGLGPGSVLALSVPNPVRGPARVTYSLPEAGGVALAVFDALGRRVAVLVEGRRSASAHTVPLAGLAPGVYVLRLQSGAETVTRTVSVLR